MAYLEIDDEQLPLGESNTLGRGDSAEIQIDDASCSREHARIERRPNGWTLRDLASANGTLVNGASVTQKRLEDGDVVEIGDASFVFRNGRPVAAHAEKTARRSSSKTPLVLGAAVLLVGVLVWQSLSGGDGEVETGASESKPKAVAEAAGDGTSGAENPETIEETPRPAAPVDPLRGRFENLRSADEETGLDDLRFQYAELAREAKDGAKNDLAREVSQHLETLEAKRQGEGQARLNRALAEARADGEAGRWGAALTRLDEALFDLRVQGLGDLARDGLRQRLEFIAGGKTDWEARMKKSRGLAVEQDTDAARAILDRAVGDFRGLNFEALARTEMRLLDLRASAALASAKAEADAAARGNRREDVTARRRDGGRGRDGVRLEGAASADRAAAERRWAEAAKGYDAVVAGRPDDEVGERLRQRARLMHAYQALKEAVIAAATTEGGIRGLKVGKITARPESADADRIVLKVGRRGEVTWTWREMSPERLLALFDRVTKDTDTKLAFARVAFDLDQPERAEAMLVRAIKRKEAKPLADEIVAAARGEAVPEVGYHVYEGRFLGPDAWATAQDRIQAERLARELPRARGRRFEELLGELAALGDPARDAFRTGLAKRLMDRADKARGLACFSKPSKARRRLTSMLEERRKEAFALIFDTARYPYPYGPNQAEVQAEVDALADKVRAVWERPEEAILEDDENWKSLRGEMVELEARLVELDGEATVVRRLDEELRGILDPKEHAWSDQHRRKIAEVRQFNDEIKSSIIAEERSCHEHTNAYRMMMGLLPVKIDEALVLAARSHSQEMKDLNYFSHTSPIADRSSPSKRAQIAGWGGGVSENIARGQRNGEAAVRGWISSSGHHRNILGSRHTHLGCGKAKDGLFWTQNFGTGASSSISREKIDPKEKAEKTGQRGD